MERNWYTPRSRAELYFYVSGIQIPRYGPSLDLTNEGSLAKWADVASLNYQALEIRRELSEAVCGPLYCTYYV
jgi:hypothetical protein